MSNSEDGCWEGSGRKIVEKYDSFLPLCCGELDYRRVSDVLNIIHEHETGYKKTGIIMNYELARRLHLATQALFPPPKPTASEILKDIAEMDVGYSWEVVFYTMRAELVKQGLYKKSENE